MNYPSAINLPSRNIASNNVASDTNTSNTEVGSLTAIKVLFARSQMYLQHSGGSDNIAPLLMKQLSLFGPNIPGSILLSQLYSKLSRWNFYLTERYFADQLVEHFFSGVVKFGEVGLLQARTCWLDDVVDSFAKKHEGKLFNVVILGAGYDTRCYRLESIMNNGNAKMYEIDAAGSQESKKQTLNVAKVDSSIVQFVSCDFETQDWMDVLQSESDFKPSLPSLFVWEGVAYYLDREVVVSTISNIVKCGAGSCIAFDYFDESCLNSTMRKSSKRIGEPLKFGIHDVDKFVKDCCNELCFQEDISASGGEKKPPLQVLDHLRCEELKTRYIAQCHGRYIGYLSEFGGFLLLGK